MCSAWGWGYFISSLPYAILAKAKALSSGIAPGVDPPTHCLAEPDIPEPPATSLNDHRRTTLVIRQAVRARLAEQVS